MTFFLYLTWHFYEAPKKIFQIWFNYFIFILHYFSVDLLSRTLFKSWRRDINVKTSSGFDLAEFIQNLVLDFFSRILGFIIRIFTIIFAFILEIVFFILSMLVFIFWLILPFILLFGFYKSFQIYLYGF